MAYRHGCSIRLVLVKREREPGRQWTHSWVGETEPREPVCCDKRRERERERESLTVCWFLFSSTPTLCPRGQTVVPDLYCYCTSTLTVYSYTFSSLAYLLWFVVKTFARLAGRRMGVRRVREGSEVGVWSVLFYRAGNLAGILSLLAFHWSVML